MTKENTPGHRVREIYLFIAIDDDDDEGVPALQGRGGMLMPMIGTDATRVNSLRETARVLAWSRGIRVELIKFSGPREVVEVWDGRDRVRS